MKVWGVPGSLRSYSAGTGCRVSHPECYNHCAWGDGPNWGSSGTIDPLRGDGPSQGFLGGV